MPNYFIRQHVIVGYNLAYFSLILVYVISGGLIRLCVCAGSSEPMLVAYMMKTSIMRFLLYLDSLLI